MSKYGSIREVIEEVFKDGKPHNLLEVREACKLRGIDMKSDNNAVHNVMFNCKKSGYLEKTGIKGEYIRAAQDKKDEKSQNIQNNKGIDLNWDEFFVLEPEKGKYVELKITISEKGEIRLNTRLQKEIDSNDIEIIFSKNYKIILLNPNTGKGHKFTKAGTTKNRECITMLRKLRIPFPITYVVEWSEHYQMWKGELKIDLKK